MFTLIVKRLFLMAIILLCVSALTFVIVNVLPGDVADTILGDFATPEQIAALREALGLNRPLIERYLEWIGGAITGDFGISARSGQPVGPLLLARLQNSLILTGCAMIVAIPLSVALGVIAAVRRGSVVDRTISTGVVAIFALPEAVLALVLVLLFAIQWPILPASSLVLPGQSVFARPMTLILPVAVVTLTALAYLSLVTRASMIAALNSGYVRTAVLKGLPRRRVIVRHALRNAMIPTLTEIGLTLGYCLGGLAVVETVFSYPGIGQLLVQSIQSRDLPIVQAAVLIVAAAYAVGNLLADIGSILLNPRLRRA